MKIDDLKNSFDAISPTEEQKDKMLNEILNAEDMFFTKSFDFRRLLATVAGIAAVIAVSVVAFNYGDFDITEEINMVAYETEGATQKNTLKEENVIKKSEKTEKRSKSNKNTQVASAKSVLGSKTEDVAADTPAPMSMARTVEPPETTTDETNENSGVAVASETKDHNVGIAVVSEKDTNNNVEWITVPSLEDAENLEEENVEIEEVVDTEEEIEETEENEEETTEVAE